MKIQLPEHVREIIETLTEHGYEAYAVGGCVRDSIIHREPGDWDITTSAKPEEVKALFRRTIDTGIEHGTVTVMMGRFGYEVTTFRVDGEYEDSRHPKSVEFTASLEEDLKRRDFTMNAMAYNHEAGVVDPFGGEADLQAGIIRCVGNPEERFMEDALRMLRAVRFSAQLGFEIEKDTWDAIVKLCPTIQNISKERIHTEFGKLLLSPHPEYMERGVECGICREVLVAFDQIADRTIPLKLVKEVAPRLDYRYAALLYEAGWETVQSTLKDLKLDNQTIFSAARLVKYHGFPLESGDIFLRKMASDIGAKELWDILEFEACFYTVTAQIPMLELIRECQKILSDIVDRGDCLTIGGLALNGADLKHLGIRPGKNMGAILKLLLERVLEDQSLNNETALTNIVQTELMEKYS